MSCGIHQRLPPFLQTCFAASLKTTNCSHYGCLYFLTYLYTCNQVQRQLWQVTLVKFASADSQLIHVYLLGCNTYHSTHIRSFSIITSVCVAQQLIDGKFGGQTLSSHQVLGIQREELISLMDFIHSKFVNLNTVFRSGVK